MENRDIFKETLKKIDEKKITPKPRWCFVCQNYFFWFLSSLSIIIGAIALGIILFIVVGQDWEIHRYLQKKLFWHLILSVPYFWVLILATFFIFGYFIFRCTKTGYRYQAFIVLATGLLIILFFAVASFLLNASCQIHNSLLQKIPLYSNLTNDADGDEASCKGFINWKSGK